MTGVDIDFFTVEFFLRAYCQLPRKADLPGVASGRG